MSIKIYENGVWRDASFVRKFNGSSWVDIEYGKRYENGQWVDVWSPEIRIGETVGFVSTPVPSETEVRYTTKVGYFAKPLTPGIYKIWIGEVEWYYIESTSYGIGFDIYDYNNNIIRPYRYSDLSGSYGMYVGSAPTSTQNGKGGNHSSATCDYPYIEITSETNVKLSGGPIDSTTLISNQQGYYTLKVYDASATRIA